MRFTTPFLALAVLVGCADSPTTPTSALIGQWGGQGVELSIDAQNHKIQTLEGLSEGGKRDPIIDAFVANDAQQCGYCTPGFVMASKAFLSRTPNPTEQQVREGLGGNFCRCGTYMGIRKAVVQAAKGGVRA